MSDAGYQGEPSWSRGEQTSSCRVMNVSQGAYEIAGDRPWGTEWLCSFFLEVLHPGQ